MHSTDAIRQATVGTNLDPNARWLRMTDNRVWLGTFLIIGSSAAYSLSGYFTRLIDVDVWAILFWRGFFGGIFIGTYVVWTNGRAVVSGIRAMGLAGAWVTGFSALATICFINALRLTTVAEVMTIHAAIPFIIAAAAWAFTGERESWVTWAASAAALVGVAIIFDPQAPTSHAAGYVFAIVMALSLSAMMVIIRAHRQVSMLPAACLSAFLCALIVLPLADPAAVTKLDLWRLFLFGTVQFGLGLLLLTVGTRMISATSSALIGSFENPLAPFWVWLAFSERPTIATWIGGGIVMTAVIVDVVMKTKTARELQPQH
jgi:drug/metabolite transporter (DMT)-like permease